MARRTKDAPGRVTPKGTTGRVTPRSTGRVTPKASAVTTSGRYTAPIPDEYRSSPWWVPTLVLAFFGIGVLGIILNYLNLLPGGPSNWYLLGGLGCIIAGFIAATRYH
jgi:hypothetical protein